MFNYTKLTKRPKQFLSVTGITVPQFDSLLKEIKKQYKATEETHVYQKRKDCERLVQDDTSLIYPSKTEF